MSFGTFSSGTQSFGTDEVSVSIGVGALAAQASLISGTGLSLSTGTGALVAQTSSALGSGVSGSTGTGALAAQSAAIAGTGLSLSTGTGALASQRSTVSGVGVSLSTGTGALLDQAAAIVGSGVSGSTGTGALDCQSATIIGSGVSESTGTGALAGQSATIFGSDGAAITGVGALASQAATVAGIGSVSVDGKINYALRDQTQRDKRRLAAKKAQIVEELKKWRNANGSEATTPDAGLDQPSDEGGDNYSSAGIDAGVLGGQLATIFGRDGPGGYTGGIAGLDGGGTVISPDTIATIDRIKRNNDLALILIMANV